MYPDEFDNLLIDDIESFNNLSVPSQVAFCLYQLEAEVNNGGFHQYFSNSSGRFTIQTLDALSKIEANKTESILKLAIGVSYPRGFPSDPEMHNSELADSDEVFDQLEALDSAFYAYEDPLADMVNRYLRNAY